MLVEHFLSTLIKTVSDVLPIIFVIFGFQVIILKRPIQNPRKVFVGLGYVLMGLSLFIVGLETTLFPIGEKLASQLVNPQFLLNTTGIDASQLKWHHYYWVYIFAFSVGFSTSIAEPALIAVSLKANHVSGGAINPLALRITVGLGVAMGTSLGTFRIVTGTPLDIYIISAYIVVIVQAYFCPKSIVALAFDSGGVTTSTVTVPLIAALGIGLSSTIPGRSPLIDGFGLIAFACLFPIISVMAYAQIAEYRANRKPVSHPQQGD